MNAVRSVICVIGLCGVYGWASVASPLHEYLNNPETQKTLTEHQLLEFLRQCDVNVDEVDPTHGTAFQMLTLMGKPEVLTVFFAKYHPNVNIRNFEGDMALHMAIRKFGETKPE